MNGIHRHDHEADEIARIREIVGRHPLPQFVTGFDVRLGEFDDEPAMWITFHTTGGRPAAEEARKLRAYVLRDLKDAIHQDLLAEVSHRYPYYRFTDMEQAQPTVS